MAPEKLFGPWILWLVNVCPKFYTFCLNFIQYLHVWIQVSWPRMSATMSVVPLHPPPPPLPIPIFMVSDNRYGYCNCMICPLCLYRQIRLIEHRVTTMTSVQAQLLLLNFSMKVHTEVHKISEQSLHLLSRCRSVFIFLIVFLAVQLYFPTNCFFIFNSVRTLFNFFVLKNMLKYSNKDKGVFFPGQQGYRAFCQCLFE